MPRQFTKGIDLYNDQVERFQKMHFGMERMHKDLALQGLEDARELTSGGISSRALRSLGHPYGRRGPRGHGVGRQRGSAPLLPINKQSGRLHESMQISSGKSGSVSFHDVGPSSSAGASLWALMPAGTRKVVARGYWPEIERRWKARNRALVDVLKSLSGGT